MYYKTFSFLILICVLTQSVNAQNCKIFLPIEEGSILKYTQYDKKDKISGYLEQEMTKISASGDTTIYQVHQTVTNDKGKKPFESDSKYKCINEMFIVDMEDMYLDDQLMESYKNMNMTVETDDVFIPSDAKAGDKLKDGLIKMSCTEPVPMNITINITNRTIESIEDVTTPAGTFSCIKLLQDVNGNYVFIKMNHHTITWLCENIGTVKTETYQGDKLILREVLTEIIK